jgi:AraC-like DNA-binding protein
MAKVEPYIQGHGIMGFAEFITEKGGEPSEIIRAVGLPLANYNRPDLVVSYRKVGAFLDEAARVLNMPSFGVECVFSIPMHIPFLAPFVTLSKFETDVRGWLLAVQRYLKVHTNGFVLELIEKENSETARLRYVSDPLTSLSKQLASTVLAKAVVAARHATDRSDLHPNCIYFRHSGGIGEQQTYQRLFGCEVLFNAEHDEIEFGSAILAQPTSGSLGLFKSAMNLYVRWQISRLETQHVSHTTMVSLAIASALGTGHVNVGNVAESLGWNAKKLQRVLVDEGTSFSEILDQVRKNTALALLHDSEIPTGKIASMLDYAGASPFNLACRRWFGQSPNEFRKRGKESMAEAIS